MDISIQHLKLVNVVVKEGSITKAAEKLFLSQPALSHQLKTLEKKIDLKVFNRVHKKLVLTEAGNLLFQTSEKMLSSINQLVGRLEGLKNGESRNIRLSTECYTTYHWLPEVINDLKKDNDKITIQIDIEATKAPIQYLLDGLIDLAIVSKKTDDPSIHFEKLVEDEMVVIMSRNNPLSVLKKIDLKDLKKENLLLYDIAEENNYVLNNILNKNTKLIQSTQKVQLTEAIIQLIKANLGISVMAEWTVAPLKRDKSFKVVPFKANLGTRIWYIASLNRPSKLENLFIDQVRSSFGQ